MTIENEQCSNCRHVITNNEIPCIYDGSVVCLNCYVKLAVSRKDHIIALVITALSILVIGSIITLWMNLSGVERTFKNDNELLAKRSGSFTVYDRSIAVGLKAMLIKERSRLTNAMEMVSDEKLEVKKIKALELYERFLIRRASELEQQEVDDLAKVKRLAIQAGQVRADAWQKETLFRAANRAIRRLDEIGHKNIVEDRWELRRAKVCVTAFDIILNNLGKQTNYKIIQNALLARLLAKAITHFEENQVYRQSYQTVKQLNVFAAQHGEGLKANEYANEMAAYSIKYHSEYKKALDEAAKAQSILFNQFKQAAANAEAWDRTFVDARLVADKATVSSPQVAVSVGALKGATPGVRYKELMSLEREGVTQSELRKSGIEPGEIAEEYAKEALKRGWFRQAISVANGFLLAGGLPPHTRHQLSRTLNKSLTAYEDVCLHLGNSAMTAQAIKLFRDAPILISKADKLLLARKAKALSSIGEPQVITAPKNYLAEKKQWVANRQGYTLSGTIQIGNSKSDNGGVDATANLSIDPGVVLQGGVIFLSEGTLVIDGTYNKPVILKNVEIKCDFGTSVSATNVIFEDCKLKKTGAYFWDAGNSTLWTFRNCLLQNSNFGGLLQRDYGIRLIQSDFVDCAFPKRSFQPGQYAAESGLLRDKWDDIEDCNFYDCTLPVSVVWMMQQCNVYLPVTIHSGIYHGQSALSVILGYPTGVSTRLADQLASKTKTSGQGALLYSLHGIFSHQPSPLWNFASPDPE